MLFGLPRAIDMPGFHVVVYSAPLPRYDRRGHLDVPGYLYFVSTGSHRPEDYEVYSQRSINRYPVVDATYHGVVSDIRTPLPARPLDWEVAYYFRNYAGNVDCYVWKRYHHPTVYACYEVVDIEDPSAWYMGSRYAWRGFRAYTAIGSRVRRAGLRRFYRLM